MPATVMIVEDDAMHMKIYSTLLQAHRYRIIEIDDPRLVTQNALDFRPKVVLVDIFMPPFEGRDIIKQLKADLRTRHVQVIALSAASDRDMQRSCKAAGASCFKAKPFPLLGLVNEVSRLARPPHLLS